MVDRKLAQLQSLADLRFEREQRALADLAARENSLKAQFDGLPKGEFPLDGAAPMQLMHRADILWRKHLDQEQRNLQMQIARIRADREVTRAAAIKAFGQKQVIKTLSKQP